METNTLLETAIQAARLGGQAALAKRHQPREVTSKGYLDVVTDADFAADAIVTKTIRHTYPDHAILSEESDQAKHMAAWSPPAGYWWCIDPIDGTNNFMRGNPSWSISVAVAQGEIIQAGVVYDPTRDDLYAAYHQQGAHCNKTPLQVAQTDFQWAIINADYPTKPDRRRKIMALTDALLPHVRTLRTWGTTALALAHLAAGYLDVYFNIGSNPWDVAAGVLLVREAGGIVTQLDGQPWHWHSPDILAVTPALQSTVADHIKSIV